MLARRKDMIRGNKVALFAGVSLMIVADGASNISTRFDFRTILSSEKPIVSASEVSGFNKVAGVNGRNVVVVIVESLGYMADATARERIASPLDTPRIADKYTVTSGRANFSGSTTSGEMRELCGTRTPYAIFAREAGLECLPGQLRKSGYSTLAIHGFSSEMFGRRDWYPQIGFEKALFGEGFSARLPRHCGSVFRGVCDADLAPLIAKEATDVQAPHFIYWLTLNTHIPVAPGDARTDYDCAGATNGFATPQVCRMAELWHDLFDAIAGLALDPAIGPAEILIVGDHAPPLWSKRGRGQFEPGHVAWYRLTPR